MSTILSVLRMGVGLLLLVATFAHRKTPAPQRLEHVNDYRLTPPTAAPAIAAILVGVEGLTGLALLFGVWDPWPQVLGTALLAGFAAAMAQALARGIVTQCGCFGTLSHRRVQPRLVIRNLVLAGVLVADAAVPGGLALDGQPGTAAATVCVLMAVIVGAGEYRRLVPGEAAGARAARP